MAVIVSLQSKTSGEIKRFLDSYYETTVQMDADVDQWVYVYNKPLDAIDIISSLMDNSDKYYISLSIQMDTGDFYHITNENHDDVVKGMFQLFYQDIPLFSS